MKIINFNIPQLGGKILNINTNIRQSVGGLQLLNNFPIDIYKLLTQSEHDKHEYLTRHILP